MKRLLPSSVIAALCFTCMSSFAGGYDVAAPAPSTNLSAYQMNNLANENGSPVISIGAPNAFGPTGTVLFLTGSYVNRWPNTSGSDGITDLGVSLGDPHKYVGVIMDVALTNLGNSGDSFGENGSFGLRVNRYLTPNTAIAVGAAVVGGWGTARNISNSFYGALTHSFHVLVPMAINVGVGTGGFSKGGDVVLAQDKNVNAFVGFGVEVVKGLSVLFDCVAKQVNVGATYTHMFGDNVPFFVSVAGRNVNRHTGSKAYLQATAGVAYIFG